MDFYIFLGEIELVAQLAVALILGMAIGTERSVAHKTAGMRTYGLVALGSCLFVIISELVVAQYASSINFDPLRVTASIVTGIGFIGAGTIIFRNKHVTGLTSAAGLWVAAGMGVAVGFQLYIIAASVMVLTLITFSFLWRVEEKIKDIGDDNNLVE